MMSGGLSNPCQDCTCAPTRAETYTDLHRRRIRRAGSLGRGLFGRCKPLYHLVREFNLVLHAQIDCTDVAFAGHEQLGLGSASGWGRLNDGVSQGWAGMASGQG